jgi:hypothetical protein
MPRFNDTANVPQGQYSAAQGIGVLFFKIKNYIKTAVIVEKIKTNSKNSNKEEKKRA